MNGFCFPNRVLFALTAGLLLAVGLLLWGAAAAPPVQAQGAAAAPRQQVVTYTVQPGDTLARLAGRYGTTVSRLVELNGIADPDLIKVGQVLTVSTDSVPALPQPPETPPTVTVRAGDTLTRIANRYRVTVDALVAANDIADPDLIEVGQVLTIPPETTAEMPPTAGGPLALDWELTGWAPADPDYTATIHIDASGGKPPYTYYHDGLVQEGPTFQLAWRRCRPKPGSVGVVDANQTRLEQEYWLEAPYCPVGIEIVAPEEGAVLTHDPRNFNIRWDHTVDPPPPEYGIEIEVQEDGEWRLWQAYHHVGDGNRLFFVPDPFPGDLPGRVRMWGIYEGLYDGPKTPWRNFTFQTGGE